ncbi:MAG: hypothetical protein AAB440_02810 [Patescibacteria group bacterium]
MSEFPTDASEGRHSTPELRRAEVLGNEEVAAALPKIAKVYIGAFAGEPWYEVSMCEDEKTPKRCEGGFSPLGIGQTCPHCDKVLTEAAYNQKDLVEHFIGVMKIRESAWYIEEVATDSEPTLALAAFAWKVKNEELVREKYKENPEAMQTFLDTVFVPGEEYVWLDEIFADRAIRAEGNLHNFKKAITGLVSKLGENKIAFRTINERLIAATLRDFPHATTVYRSPDVPDRRAIVVVDLATTPPDA